LKTLGALLDDDAALKKKKREKEQLFERRFLPRRSLFSASAARSVASTALSRALQEVFQMPIFGSPREENKTPNKFSPPPQKKPPGRQNR
jgi:hypothetical protein